MYSAIYNVIKSYLTRVLDKKIRNGYITWETRVVIGKKIVQLILKNVIKLAKGSLYKIFQDSFNKFYFNSKLMTDPIYLSSMTNATSALSTLRLKL